ncbi:hypothetical protein JCM11251_005486 [Rhodosporidiobolus azoricus]
MSCATVTRDGAVVTSYSTSSLIATSISIDAGSTVATSSPVLVTSCAEGDTAGCATSTSYSTGATVLPGSTRTITRTVPTVVAVVTTAPGAVETVCEAPTSTTTTSSPSSSTAAASSAADNPPSSTTTTSATTEDEPAPSSTTEVTTRTTIVSNGPSTSFVRSTTTIPVPSSSSSPSAVSDEDVAGASNIASTPPSSTLTEAEFVTSYRTIFVTTIDSSGRTQVFESAVPTLLNAAHSGGGGGSNAGPIAGGVVGGVAALVLAAVVFWLMRKKGYFRRGDEEFEGDVWAPRPHSQFFAAGGAGGAGGGGSAGSGEGGGSDGGEDKLDALSEKEQAIDAATLERHRSWYNSMGSRHGHAASAGGSGEGAVDEPELLSMEEVYGGMVQQAPYRAPSPSAGVVLGAGLAAGGPPRRSTSNRISVYSGSSHSHDGHAAGGVGYSPQTFVAPPLPPVPDHRLSLQHAYFQNFSGPASAGDQELGPIRTASPPALSAGVLPYLHQRPRSVSPPPMATHDYPHLHRHPSVPSLSAATAIPPHLRSNSTGSNSHLHRPAFEAIQSGGQHMRELSSTSSSSYYGSSAHGHASGPPARTPSTGARAAPAPPQRMQTTDSFSSAAPSSYASRSNTSGASSSRQITPPSSAAPTAPSTPLDGKIDLPSLTAVPPVPALPVMPSIERLRADEPSSIYPKRPGFDRAASSESFIYVPSQWLGARVVNADAGSVAETLDSSLRREEEEERLAGESVDSLGLVKGERGQVEEREVVVDVHSALTSEVRG